MLSFLLCSNSFRTPFIAAIYSTLPVDLFPEDNFGPISIFLAVRVDGLNAACADSLTARYLPSFTDDVEYITTNKAKRSVIKSAYETSHRSWFSCSSCFFFDIAAPACPTISRVLAYCLFSQ